ncbi:hypothetical protein OCH239_20775 [Roseivivax halodurans JCM 10272]|uniref:Uncharacterized protein n=2 Tax=Roseivivax halodurans TaxID=93683 RepID=X7EIC6_9RHOB|nr:hypothetical protein OCH239_20775 [Roseivivax halodurans JCM 10272]
MQHLDVDKTTKQLVSFLTGIVPWNYSIAKSCAKWQIEDGIDRRTALHIVREKGSALGRKHNAEVVEAWFDFVAENPISGVRAFDDFVEWFPLGPGIRVPIKPLTVVRDQGHFSPVFFIPWSKIPFSDYQARLLFSILERSIFRHTDFEKSPGKIIFFPKVPTGSLGWQRKPSIWCRGDFDLLTDTQIIEQIEVFEASRERAKEWFEQNLG